MVVVVGLHGYLVCQIFGLNNWLVETLGVFFPELDHKQLITFCRGVNSNP